ncbi:hypothetical protein OQA88_13504 [Cercophora sp. LCS_1]
MSSPESKPMVVGIYGLPGSGKSFLLRQLQKSLESNGFDLIEGSAVIDSLTPGGLEAFKTLPDAEKTSLRLLAISMIREKAAQSGKTAVVAGHYMFWPEEEETGTKVLTHGDIATYTHILYLDVASHTIVQRRQSDTERARPDVSVRHVQRWQQAEITELRDICRQNNIFFVTVPAPAQETRVTELVLAFCKHTNAIKTSHAEKVLDDFISSHHQHKKLDTILVFDADKTLSVEDTGAVFWALASPDEQPDTLKQLFSGPMGYSDAAFRQAALLYSEIPEGFDHLCSQVASSVKIRPELLRLLESTTASTNTSALVITCGLQQIWTKILALAGCAHIPVLGSGLPAHPLLVTPSLKAHLVERLRKTHGLTVRAFGDSTLDIPMLAAANHAVVVTQPSTSMLNALERTPLRNAHQLILPPTRTPYPSLPVISLALCHHPVRIYTAQSGAAKILSTSHRDARLFGPALRASHQRAGWYLAMTHLTKLLGIEEIPGGIPHVQGHTTEGHHLRHEMDTLIIALMRGGEPMALGVSEAFPAAGFLHAKTVGDVKEEHLNGMKTVLLVDSVVNTGKSAMEFVDHVSREGVRVIIVAGVVQASAVGVLAGTEIVALRVSENRFVGRGGTDTGNRLFGTVRLE